MFRLQGPLEKSRLEWNEGADMLVTLSAITWGGPGEAASLPGTLYYEDEQENDESMNEIGLEGLGASAQREDCFVLPRQIRRGIFFTVSF